MTKKKEEEKLDKELMLAAKELRRAFEKRKMGAYEQVLDLFPSLTVTWRAVLREKRKLTRQSFKPTVVGMRSMRRLLRQLHGELVRLQATSSSTIQRISSCTSNLDSAAAGAEANGLPTLDDCYAQLVALKKEFGNCTLENDGKEIVVTSHEVTLDDIFFGKYYIKIQLEKIAANNRGFYDIYPASPDCPMVDGASPHPHVMGRRLCEGDGGLTMTKSFDDGRLFDCCILVNSILQTYSDDSPYFTLDMYANDGRGAYTCSSCEADIHEGNQFVCESCDDIYCHDCMAQCTPTGHWFCDGCVETAVANNAACLGECSHLGGVGCIVRENKPCPECARVFPDAQLAKCEIVTDEEQFCVACAKEQAVSQTPCDSCLMHGYIGCALLKFGYPMLDTLNHPAYVEAVGRQHRHHGLGWHAASMRHPYRDGDTRADFLAYGKHLARQGGLDRARRPQPGVIAITPQLRVEMFEEDD